MFLFSRASADFHLRLPPHVCSKTNMDEKKTLFPSNRYNVAVKKL
jgi:hypothetical protein